MTDSTTTTADRVRQELGLPRPHSLEMMTLAYVEALYFTETGDEGRPSHDAELTSACVTQVVADCRDFHDLLVREKIWDRIENSAGAAPTWANFGRDFWFTRNRHGTGFWDRTWLYGGRVADWLTAVTKAYGEFDAEFEEE